MRRIFSLLPWLFLTLGIAPLLTWAVLGFSTRYLADDYSTASTLLQKGFWPAQVFWYLSWSGRYSFTFVVSFVELLGVWVVPFLPALGLLAWLLTLFWVLKQFFHALSISLEKPWLAVLAATVIFGAVKSIKDYSEILFWQTGILTYQISLILFCVALALFLKRFFSPVPDVSLQTPKSFSFELLRVLRGEGFAPALKVAPWEYIVAFLLAFIIGGFSETWIILQVAILTLALLYFPIFYKGPNRNDIVHMLLTAYLASWCAFLAIIKSPGNAERTVRMTRLSLESVFGAMFASIADVPVFLVQWLTGNTALAAGLFLVSLAIGFVALPATGADTFNRRAHLFLGGGLLALTVGLMGVGFLPAFVVWGTRPVDRAAFLPIFLFILAFVVFGFFTGRVLAGYVRPGKSQAYARTFLLVVLVLMMFWLQARTTLASLQLLPALQTYARLWDERDAFLRAASLQKKGEVVVPSVRRNPALHDIRDTIWMLGELSEDKRDWINRVAAAYYGVKSISGK